MVDVAALGELLVDFTCRAVDGEGYPTLEAHPGGAPANFLAALARCGAKTALLGKVGTDSFGTLLRGSLERAGIDTRGVVAAEDVFTTLAFVTLDGRGERTFSFARKPGADTCLRPEELALELLREARVFHFGTLSLTHQPSRSATLEAVRLARDWGKLITFDPNLRKPLWDDLADAAEWMAWGLRQADVVKISEDEVDFLLGCGPEQGAERLLSEYGARLVFVTCGERGCLFQNGRARGFVPALPGVHPADATGAGDIFGGSAVWGLLRADKAPAELEEDELRAITAYACAAAGLSVERPGGISSVPDPAEVLAAMKRYERKED